MGFSNNRRRSTRHFEQRCVRIVLEVKDIDIPTACITSSSADDYLIQPLKRISSSPEEKHLYLSHCMKRPVSFTTSTIM